jgi:hypothetical protein
MRGARVLLVVWSLVASTAWGFDHSHAAWDALLKKHVVLLDGGKASRLRYAAMAQERTQLKRYLATLSAVPQKEFDGWSREEKMAFLINVYNAFTVEKILTRYPDIRSIWDFGRIFGNPFKDGFFSLIGRQRSLDIVEHELLRPVFKEARVHYAVNCASIGCPMLREEAYVPARLDRQLDEQTARFLSDRSRNRYRDGRLEVSKIFDWFKEDFEPRARYFARHAALLSSDPQHRGLIAQGNAPLVFVDYDWSLNDAAATIPASVPHSTPASESSWSMVREGSAQPASPTTLAGTPATVTFLGTGCKTTDPAATRAHGPTSILPRIFAPAPISTPWRIFG